MEVNICPRLIEIMIKNGTNFIYNSSNYYNTDSLPKGLYSTKIYNEGDIIRELRGVLLLKPSKYSIHIGNGLHVIDDYGQYINHSFEPNTKIEQNKVICIKRIEIYDEITFNYNESEINMDSPFEYEGIKVSGK